ncbi:hypothetical protein HPP92_003409 [Vanilla planifolia]|uniref:Uncharacterized protein n=1 Tax=Vanilla planifolia TaxID=51239 RepID=A0A835SFJ5_VANPL|nr:hypothetical protein HPP92_003409 [Vanilla planifolia]
MGRLGKLTVGVGWHGLAWEGTSHWGVSKRVLLKHGPALVDACQRRLCRWCHGSPVHRYGLYALQWIVEVNGKLTPDLESFLNVVKELEHGEFVRVRTVHLNGKPRVLTLKQDLLYWPTWELRFDPETATYRRRTIKSLSSST